LISLSCSSTSISFLFFLFFPISFLTNIDFFKYRQ
jgi:hypothetical protein